jgi:hypothetical protein
MVGIYMLFDDGSTAYSDFSMIANHFCTLVHKLTVVYRPQLNEILF